MSWLRESIGRGGGEECGGADLVSARNAPLLCCRGCYYRKTRVVSRVRPRLSASSTGLRRGAWAQARCRLMPTPASLSPHPLLSSPSHCDARVAVLLSRRRLLRHVVAAQAVGVPRADALQPRLYVSLRTRPHHRARRRRRVRALVMEREGVAAEPDALDEGRGRRRHALRPHSRGAG